MKSFSVISHSVSWICVHFTTETLKRFMIYQWHKVNGFFANKISLNFQIMKTHSPFALNQHVAQMEHEAFEYSIRQKRRILMKLYWTHDSKLGFLWILHLIWPSGSSAVLFHLTCVIKIYLSFLFHGWMWELWSYQMSICKMGPKHTHGILSYVTFEWEKLNACNCIASICMKNDNGFPLCN